VVGEPEEAVCFGGVDQLVGDLFDSVFEVVQGYLGDGAVGVFRWCHCETVRWIYEGESL